MIAFLEAKLNSVPDLNDGSTMDDTPTAATSSSEAGINGDGGHDSNDNYSNNNSDEQTQNNINNGNQTMEEPIVETKSADGIVDSEHPDYAQFFRLLKVGVPLPVVQTKVTAAGKRLLLYSHRLTA